MLDFIITDSGAARLLLNRKAAAILGVAGVLSIGALIIRYVDLNSAGFTPLEYEALSIAGAAIASGYFLLLICMGFFWLKCDVSPKFNRTVWFVVLLLGFAYGSAVAYYALVYLPVVVKRIRNPREQAPAALPPQDETSGKVIGPFGWALIVGWGLSFFYFAAGFMFPKIVFQSTSHILGPGNTYIVLWLWTVSLAISTAIYAVILLLRGGMRRSAGSLPPTPPNLKHQA